MPALKVLIADDEPLSSMALRSQLEALGHEIVVHARNGHDAVDFARCFPIDLAIVDYRMPDLRGFDAAARIFHDRPTPLLLMSGHAETDTTADDRPPVYHYLRKPADLSALERAIDLTIVRFKEWLRLEADPDEVRRKNDDARIIHAAYTRLAGSLSPHQACRALVVRSQDRGHDLLAAARAILDDTEQPAP